MFQAYLKLFRVMMHPTLFWSENTQLGPEIIEVKIIQTFWTPYPVQGQKYAIRAKFKSKPSD